MMPMAYWMLHEGCGASVDRFEGSWGPEAASQRRSFLTRVYFMTRRGLHGKNLWYMVVLRTKYLLKVLYFHEEKKVPNRVQPYWI